MAASNSDWSNNNWNNCVFRMKIDKYTIWLILLINIIIFGLLNWGLPIRFEENDDVFMCLIANGGYTGVPDCHLVFINALYGKVLTWLYAIIPSIEWYTISFCVLHIISMTSIIYYIVSKEGENKIIIILWSLFVYVIWICIVLSLQFTTTAGIVVIAGCCLMYRNKIESNILGGILIVIASLIRFQVVGLVVLLWLPVFVFRFNLEYKKYIPLLIVGLCVILLKIADTGFYQSPEWKYFKEYNYIRGQLNDNPNANNDDIFNQLPPKIKEADYNMFLNFMADPTIMNLETIKKLNQNIKRIAIEDKIKNVSTLQRYASVLFLLACITILLLIGETKRNIIFVLLSFLLFFIVAVKVSLDGTLKNRVFLCMLLSIIMVYYNMILYTKKDKYIVVCLIGAMLLLDGKYIKQIYKVQCAVKNKLTIWDKTSQLLQEMPIKNSYVIPIGTDMFIEAVPPLNVQIPNCNLLCLGWLTSIPFHEGLLNTHTDLLYKNIYIYTSTDNTLSTLKTTLFNNYFVEVVEKVIVHNETNKIIKLMPIDNEYLLQ